MFINLSNHSSKNWEQKQIAEAEKYGQIIDFPFPAIDPDYSSEDIDNLVNHYAELVLAYDEPVVMLQGEFVFTYRLICKLKDAGIKVISACSRRQVVEYKNDSGVAVRESKFIFERFMEY